MKKVYLNRIVSIIVPVYNSEKYIEKCIMSILNQTYKYIELILINDGSIDNSGQLCDTFAKLDNRIKVEHMKNLGVSSARNKGIKAATGKFIQFVDSDDYIEPNMIETLINEINRNIDLVFCGYTRVSKGKNGEINIKAISLNKQVNMTKKTFLNEFGILFKHYYINYLWNKLYVVDIIKKYNLEFDSLINWGEDLIFNLQYLEHCGNITIIDKQLYNYVNYNDNSITSTFNKELYNNQNNMYKSVRKFLIKNNVYTDTNKDIVELKFTDSIIMSLNNLFYKDSDCDKLEIKKQISRIIEDDILGQDLKYFNIGGFQKKIVGKLIKNKFLHLIIYFYKTKEYIRRRKNFLYKIFKK
nr:glycosyltransferase [Clostridium estertheticum]